MAIAAAFERPLPSSRAPLSILELSMAISPYLRRRLSTTARETLYDRCRGDAEFPTCNICGQLILVGDAWDESHDPEGPPRCFGGTETGIAHRPCNRKHGAQVVRPMDAKATRNRQKHIGAFRTRNKLPGGRDDFRKRRIDGTVVIRY
jgi:hypothetical protein